MDLFVTLLVIVLGFAVVGTGFFLFIKLRPKFPSIVNCWFCNKNTKVPYEKRNEWTCPFCEQYNGFSSDGGYNKLIPAQYDFLMNPLVTAPNTHNYKNSTASKFCRSCMINQQLKIQQLASFVPLDEDNFEEEIEQYRVHLERAYKLCPSCEGVLKDTLTRQKAWLLRLQSKKCKSYLKGKQQVYGKLLAAASSKVHLARALSASICTIMLASATVNGGCLQKTPSLAVLSIVPNPSPASESLMEWLLFCHRSVALAASGMLLQVVAAMCAGTNRCYRDVCGIGGWTLLLLQYWAAIHVPLKDYIHTEGSDCINVVTLLATLTFSLLPFLTPTVSKSTLKKIQSDSFKRSDMSVQTASEEQNEEVPEELNKGKNLNCNKDSSYFANKYSPEMGIQKKMCDETIFHVTDSSKGYKKSLPNDVSANTSNTSGPYNRFHRAKCYSIDPYFEQDLHHSLCSLSLGTASRPRSRRWAFESRVYGGKELPGLFTAADNRPRPLLSPPRLGFQRNVTRSPWSAGGYWQTPTSFVVGHDGSPLSRSSSRSSGFGSLSSRAAAAAASPPGSRAGSVCAGDDRFSVHSLPAYPPNFPPTYFPFYGAPYLMPHLGGYAIAPPYCFAPSPPPASASPQSSPALSDSDSSSASQKGTRCSEVHRGFVDILKENAWLSFVIGSSLLLNAVATVFFIFTNRNFLAGVP